MLFTQRFVSYPVPTEDRPSLWAQCLGEEYSSLLLRLLGLYCRSPALSYTAQFRNNLFPARSEAHKDPWEVPCSI